MRWRARAYARLCFRYIDEDCYLTTRIFCASDSENVKGWSVDAVLEFLRESCPQGTFLYLEHLINENGDRQAKLHDNLIEQYVIKVKQLMKNYVQALTDGKQPPVCAQGARSLADETTTKAGDEDGELGVYREKLLKFLVTSLDYDAPNILLLFDDHLIEEKALVLGRLKRHEEALLIYTSFLMNFAAAEQHCERHYDPDDGINSQVSERSGYFRLFLSSNVNFRFSSSSSKHICSRKVCRATTSAIRCVHAA